MEFQRGPWHEGTPIFFKKNNIYSDLFTNTYRDIDKGAILLIVMHDEFDLFYLA